MENDELPASEGTSWPEYQTPTDVPRDEPPAQPAGTQPGQPPAQPSTPSGEAPAAAAGTEGVIPKYRLDETIAERDRYYEMARGQQQQIEMLLRRLEQPASGQQPTAPPEPPSPQDLAIRDRLLQVFPELKLLDELKEIAAQKQNLLGAAQAVPQWRTAETQYYDRYVERTLGSIADQVAIFTLGQGKTAKDLNPLVADSLIGTFTKWIRNDPGRTARFEAEDPSIPREFWAAYKQAHYDPITRDKHASLLQRAANPPNVPVGGGGAPVAAGAPRTEAQDEDAIHAHAWSQRDNVGVR